MIVRLLTTVALCACAAARTQPAASTKIETDYIQDSAEAIDEVEKRDNQELQIELKAATADALLLYTEFSSQLSLNLKNFHQNISHLISEATADLDRRYLHTNNDCSEELCSRLMNIRYNIHRSATFDDEKFHKYIQGYYIVLTIHLNKTENLLRKIQNCGVGYDTSRRVTRWRRLAVSELSRVRGDIHSARLAYRDLVIHQQRKNCHLRVVATRRAKEAVEIYHKCIRPLIYERIIASTTHTLKCPDIMKHRYYKVK